MLKFLLLTLGFFWIGRWLVRLVVRAFLPGAGRPPRERPRRTSPPRSEASRDSLRDLTQQEISDADFEELPPDEESRS